MLVITIRYGSSSVTVESWHQMPPEDGYEIRISAADSETILSAAGARALANALVGAAETAKAHIT